MAPRRQPYRVELSQAEREDGAAKQRKAFGTQAQTNTDPAPTPASAMKPSRTTLGVGGSTVYRTKPRFVLGNLEAALTTEKAWATQLTSQRVIITVQRY